MAKRKIKKSVKSTKSVPEQKEPETQTQKSHFMDNEIEAMERQIGAIKAIRDVKIENMLTELRLLRSRFSEEQLKKPVLEVFKETMPNLSIVRDKENKFEVVWKDKESMSMNCGDVREVHASLLQRLSMAYPHCSSSIPPLGGAFDYSSNAGITSFLGADNLHLKDIVMEEPSDTQTLAMQEGLQTPGVSSQRLSVGMTPKTLRLPKPGEVLLSVHGSPLGVYKENNMEAIKESEEA